ncbi:DUF924 family protein [Alcaligenes nematophilus]|jgi:uncharacterized protein (DUF924 family)|uniref:DUF924 domain-containing protein n=1 Tax=Alcaligenes faecalis TaxID=511 RepID=A0A2U2BER4_ALCFA|nr:MULTISPECIES: DUF924 family protein [Alcaligenes]MDK7588107.1 DUF924 family protein [Alcaligenes phenolicus]ALO39411.1 hypothetical protein UZ73_14740 [Alcaligenes faecalis]KAA1283629.1 DUF924 family protein [Alcaligenes faecalis]MBQ0219422.1 DUF924 family protein [Alcaligenes faecalis]MBY6318627.1 DUF924 family protein [Alcaligenes faecalis]
MADARPNPQAVIDFWVESGPEKWFRKSDDFDREFRERFLDWHERAAKGELDDWAQTAEGAYALLILLDQFPRNSFRNTTRMYATDEKGLAIAKEMVAKGLDKQIPVERRVFCYLPYSHAENLADQQEAVRLNQEIGRPWLDHAEEHLDVVERFGRFPHRNSILGRTTTAEEQKFLEAGGFSG